VLGNGVGGTVVTIDAGVDGGVVGRRVVSTTGGSGGYAERVAVDADALVEVPVGLDLADAVALLADGRTAMGLMDLAEIRSGENVLVEAAAGGVGSVLVQLAVHTGATVVAAAGGSRKVTLAAELGATVALDYSEPGWVDRVTDQVGALDVVFDGVGGDIGLAAFGLLAEHGRFLPFGMASGAFTPIPEDDVEHRHLSVVRSGPKGLEEMNELTRRALAAASAGEVRPVIGQTFPLERASEAHAAIAARATVGKTLLLVDPTGAKK
jgi:NADPH2:quinone reductase